MQGSAANGWTMRVPARAALLALAITAVMVPGLARSEPLCGSPPDAPALRFRPPAVIDPVRSGGEPSVIGLDDGTLLYASHAATTLFKASKMPDTAYVQPYTGATYLWQSVDGGSTWRYVGLGGLPAGPHGLVSGFSDPDLTVDAAGVVYTSGINLANVYVAASRDAGATWTGNNLAATVTDREWLAADEPGVVYMVGNQGGRRMWKSVDGGASFEPVANLPSGGPPTKPVVDRRDGTVYFSTGAGAVAAYRGARSGDFTATLAGIPGGTPHVWGFLNPIAVDDAGNLYVASNTASVVSLSVSTDGGATWRTSVVHDAAPRIVLWPWVSAGSDGRVGVSWLESDRPVASTEYQPAEYRVVAATSITGHGWTDGCGIERPPSWDVQVATPGPIHSGYVCRGGTSCVLSELDRRLGDYHTNAITADGTLVIAYGNTTFMPSSAVSKPGFVAQDSGPDLRG